MVAYKIILYNYFSRLLDYVDIPCPVQTVAFQIWTKTSFGSWIWIWALTKYDWSFKVSNNSNNHFCVMWGELNSFEVRLTQLHNFTWRLSCHPPVSLPPTLNRSQELQELYGSVPSLGTFTGNPTNDRSKGPVSFMWGGEGGVVTLTRPCIITHHRYAPGPGDNNYPALILSRHSEQQLRGRGVVAKPVWEWDIREEAAEAGTDVWVSWDRDKCDLCVSKVMNNGNLRQYY